MPRSEAARIESTPAVDKPKTRKGPKYSKFLWQITDERLSVGKFNIGCSIAPDGHYMFIEVPKAASTSILRVLHDREDPSAKARMHNEHHRSESPMAELVDYTIEEQKELLLGDSCIRFSFVRDPYTRLLSAYLSKVFRPTPTKRELLAYVHGKDKSEIENLDEEISFPRFVDIVCNQAFTDMNSHWRLQTYQMLLDRIDYHFIGKFENLEADFNKIAQQIYPGEHLSFGQASKVRTGSDSRMEQYYDDLLREKVYCKFVEDFDALEYRK